MGNEVETILGAAKKGMVEDMSLSGNPSSGISVPVMGPPVVGSVSSALRKVVVVEKSVSGEELMKSRKNVRTFIAVSPWRWTRARPKL
jgi:hypothetical protein